ncbi:MAG TPA: hypothetical protein PK849_10625 [Synergistales bacterium]|nr:hypothetical protein [Synergistales bacterium]HPE66620.1 hypothetical protein [Synergistales bacterium]
MNAKESARQFLREVWRLIKEDTVPSMQEYLNLPEWDKIQLAGMGMCLGDIYKAFEQSLRCILENIEGKKIEKNESWHSNLLRLSNEMELIPTDIRDTVQGMLKYRHHLHHGYGVKLNERLIRKYAPEAIDAFDAFTKHIISRYFDIL